MKPTLSSLAVSLAPVVLALAWTAPASAAPIGSPGSTATAADTTLATPIGGRRSYSRDCTPYNGPFGYYGNPYCEGGFSRYGDAGGYEIDLTPYFDGRYYSGRYHRDRRARRYR